MGANLVAASLADADLGDANRAVVFPVDDARVGGHSLAIASADRLHLEAAGRQEVADHWEDVCREVVPADFPGMAVWRAIPVPASPPADHQDSRADSAESHEMLHHRDLCQARFQESPALENRSVGQGSVA